MWLGSPLTWDEKQMLLEERKKYPPNDGCLMLYFNNKVSQCLIHAILGADKKEANCQNYFC